jgi:hypothetical protein
MVVTDAGVNAICRWLVGDPTAVAPTHVATGSDNTQPTTDDTQLGTEVLRQAIAGSSKTNNEVLLNCIFDSTQANGSSMKECGLFNDDTTGEMFIRFAHGTIDKDNTIEVEYEITLKVINP